MDMLEKFNVHLADHCNLNCKGCTHFSPLADKVLLNLDDFSRDMMRMSELTQGRVGMITLIGGEPLLNPDIVKFLPVARQLFPKTRIVIITNGVLLPLQGPEFWSACHNNNIQIWLSDYRLKIDYETIKQIAQKYEVFFGYTSFDFDEDNNKLWGKWSLDLEGKQHWVKSFERCSISNCVSLRKGKLYTCPTIAYIDYFNKHFNQNLEVTKFDYIDIYEIDDFKSILDTMVKPTPFCRYCRTGEWQSVFWEPSKKELSEWT